MQSKDMPAWLIGVAKVSGANRERVQVPAWPKDWLGSSDPCIISQLVNLTGKGHQLLLLREYVAVWKDCFSQGAQGKGAARRVWYDSCRVLVVVCVARGGLSIYMNFASHFSFALGHWRMFGRKQSTCLLLVFFTFLIKFLFRSSARLAPPDTNRPRTRLTSIAFSCWLTRLIRLLPRRAVVWNVSPDSRLAAL